MCVSVQSTRALEYPAGYFDDVPDAFIESLITVTCGLRNDLVADAAIKCRHDIIRYEVLHELWMLKQAVGGGQQLGPVTGVSVSRAGSTTTKSLGLAFQPPQTIDDTYAQSHYGRMWKKLWSALAGWAVP